MADTKTCKVCGLDKPLAEMTPRKKNGKTYFTNRCKKCESLRTQKWQSANPEKYQRLQDALKATRKTERKINRARTILTDSRGDDRKKGRENDLTLDFIETTIARGCRYCGEITIKMTLDRIDNAKGHTQGNVVPACIRCNYIRKDMPYAAWLVVAKGMREAREQGLFGDWGAFAFK